MTRDARLALERAGFSRRALLKGSGALIVSFSAASLMTRAGLSAFLQPQPARASASQLDSWLAIGSDGVVTAYTGKCELGQGLHTAQAQLVAEELSVRIDRVRLVMCDTAQTPDQGTTSGSQSHPANFNQAGLARAAATAREALIDLAADKLGVARDRLTTGDGFVRVKDNPSGGVSYGDLVGGRQLSVPLNPNVARKPSGEWKVLGTSVPRVDLPALVTAELEFVHNVRLPGMLHGVVVRPPEVGATLSAVDGQSVNAMPGVVKIVVRNDFVGVVADKPWQAIQAAAKLKVSWTPGVGLPARDTFYDQLRKQPSRDALIVDSGDVDQRLSSGMVVRATYLHPYQMHGSLGTSCAVADVKPDGATIYSASQAVFGLRSTIASILNLPVEHVRVIFTRGSGCYGINGADTVSFDAAIMSQAVGRPVRVQLSRKDEMAWENYGFAYVIDQRAVLDDAGGIVAWDHESWYPSLGGRPGYDLPGNVISGVLAGVQSPPFSPRTPAPPVSGRFNNGSNAAPSYVTGCAGGACGGTGSIKSERVLTHTSRSPFFTGPLRSPSRLQNTFAHESFIDEIASRVRADPVAYRVRHLRDERLIAVLNAAAKAANWQTRPSPRAGQPRTGVANGRGIACVLYEGDNGYCALVAELEVDQSTGAIRVKRLTAAQDCGPISSPDGMKSQIEGGALQGLSRALGEEVTWDDKKVTSVDWRSYQTLTLGFSPPEINSVLINRSSGAAMGAGETTITIVAAAVANAIFDATGARVRQVPFTPARVAAALAARA